MGEHRLPSKSGRRHERNARDTSATPPPSHLSLSRARLRFCLVGAARPRARLVSLSINLFGRCTKARSCSWPQHCAALLMLFANVQIVCMGARLCRDNAFLKVLHHRSRSWGTSALSACTDPRTHVATAIHACASAFFLRHRLVLLWRSLLTCVRCSDDAITSLGNPIGAPFRPCRPRLRNV